jgi:hypothetical protein
MFIYLMLVSPFRGGDWSPAASDASTWLEELYLDTHAPDILRMDDCG